MNAAVSKSAQTVLLIEDNPADARLLKELIAEVPRSGFVMETCETLEDGLKRLAQEDISLVMVDLSLPDSHGLDTFAKVHAASPQVPIIVMSGLDDEDLAIKTVQEGAQDYLVKGQVDSRLLVRSMHYAIERKHVEEALAKERDLLHTLLDNLPDCIYVKDRKSRFLRVSRALAQKFKLNHPREAWMKSDFDFFSHEHAEEALADERQVMETGQPILGKIERETLPDGSVTWALTSKLPLLDKNGVVIGSFGISRDITEMKLFEDQLKQAHADLKKSHEDLKAAQFQLIQAEKMQSIGRLAAGVAHEVKNPLAILRMGIDYLSGNLPAGDENAVLILSDMNEAIKRADGIILGLLDFSVPAALDIHPCYLNAVVEESLALVRHEMASPKVALVKHLEADMPQVWVDRNKIKQALVNLFTNAIHAMPQGGTLTLRSAARPLEPGEVDPDLGSRLADRFRAGDRAAVLEILDTGQGIPEDKLAKIFDPFFTTKPTGKGTGLGLTVTKKIVELHGGTIDIRNRKEGGASVTLVLKL